MRYHWLLSLMLLTACGGDLLEDHFELPWTSSVAIMKGSRTITNSPSSTQVDLDMIVLHGKLFGSVKGDYSAQEAVEDFINPYEKMLPTAISFNKFSDEEYSFSFNNLALVNDQESNQAPFSIGVLLDLSSPEVYSGFGYENQRLESLIGMIQLAEDTDEFLIGTYQKKAQNGGLELIRPDFVRYSDDLAIELGQITEKAGGSTPLYDAAFEMLDLMDSKSNNNEKHLIIYATKGDNASQSGFGRADLVQKAQSLDITISVIWADNSSAVDFGLVSEVTSQTGGFGGLAIGNLEGEVSTMFLSSLSILRNQYPFYTLSFEIEDPANGITEPFNYKNYLWVEITDDNADGRGSSLFMNDPIIYFVE